MTDRPPEWFVGRFHRSDNTPCKFTDGRSPCRNPDHWVAPQPERQPVEPHWDYPAYLSAEAVRRILRRARVKLQEDELQLLRSDLNFRIHQMIRRAAAELEKLRSQPPKRGRRPRPEITSFVEGLLSDWQTHCDRWLQTSIK